MNSNPNILTTPMVGTTNTSEARTALLRLTPHLPEPRLTEWMNVHGINLPNYTALALPNTPPLLEMPRSLLEELGPYHAKILPKRWLPSHEHHKQRWTRTVQLLRFHGACVRAELGAGGVPDVSSCDGVVAGLLLLLVKPRPGRLRKALFRIAAEHPFGAYLTSHAMLLEQERVRVSRPLGKDSRLAAALCRRDPSWADELLECLLASKDIWAATIIMDGARAEAWLAQVVAKANEESAAALTALVLQPSSGENCQRKWISALLKGGPILACLAVRWTKHTWEPVPWGWLCDQLRPSATSDRGRSWFLWYRDVEPEATDEALQNDEVDTLWAAELVRALQNSGQALRRRCTRRLQSNPFDSEVRLMLRWLDQRRQAP